MKTAQAAALLHSAEFKALLNSIAAACAGQTAAECAAGGRLYRPQSAWHQSGVGSAASRRDGAGQTGMRRKPSGRIVAWRNNAPGLSKG